MLRVTALKKVLASHDAFCVSHTAAGHGRCSCGRDQALRELEVLCSGFTQLLTELAPLHEKDAANAEPVQGGGG